MKILTASYNSIVLRAASHVPILKIDMSDILARPKRTTIVTKNWLVTSHSKSMCIQKKKKEQGPRPRKKYSFFTKVTECFSGYFYLTSTPAGGTLSLARQHWMSPQVMEGRLLGLSRWFGTILERTRFCSIGFKSAPTRRHGWMVSVSARQSRDAGSILNSVAFFFLSFTEESSLKNASEHRWRTSSRWPSG